MMRRGVRRTARRTTRRMFRRRLVIGGATLFVVGGVAHKLSQKDTQKIEQQSGKPVDQMSEPELQAAMQKAGVQEQEITPQDEQAMDKAEEQEKTPVP